MESISDDKKCNSNKDCDSNVCELIYENGKPKGRYCLVNTNNKYTIKCKSHKDCNSGNCQQIFDDDGNYVTAKCIKAPKIDKDTPFNELFGKERSNEFGTMNANTISLKVGDRGPVTEIIIKIFSIIGNLFNILIFNFDICKDNERKCKDKEVTAFGGCSKKTRKSKCSVMMERPNHGILYGIWLDIFNGLFGSIMKKSRHGLFWSGIQRKHYDSCKGQCKKTSKGIDLWYIRTLLTILFPPFGVFLAKGFKGMGQIILSCILTACFYFPGLIYSFSVINGSEHEIDEIINIGK